MKRKNLFEIIGVLSLSFMLTCAMAISGAIPAMIEAFPGYSRSSVEFLLSVTSFMMMLMVALSPIISKYIPERLIVITGLVIYTISGITPVFIQSYPVMFISRILLGLGTGLINTKAISMIGERFTGELQQKLQGIRCHVNLIPVNEVKETGCKKSSRDRIESFSKILEKSGFAVTVRRKLGSDINASCGQLRRSNKNKE